MEARRSWVSFLRIYSPWNVFEIVYLTDPELTQKVKLAGQRSPWIYLSLPLQCPYHNPSGILPEVLGIKLKFSCLHGSQELYRLRYLPDTCTSILTLYYGCVQWGCRRMLNDGHTNPWVLMFLWILTISKVCTRSSTWIYIYIIIVLPDSIGEIFELPKLWHRDWADLTGQQRIEKDLRSEGKVKVNEVEGAGGQQ